MKTRRNIHRDILNILIHLLRYSGIWSYVDDSILSKKLFFSAYNILMYTFVWILMLTLLTELLGNLSDVEVAIDNTCLLAGIIMMVIKITMFHVRRKEAIDLIQRIHGPMNILAKTSEPAVFILIKNYVFYEKIVERFFFIGDPCLGVAVLLQNPIINGSLPLKAKFPFDTTIEPFHTAAVLSQVIGFMGGLCAMAGIGGITVNMCRWTTFQLEILNWNLMHCSLKWPRGKFNSKAETFEGNYFEKEPQSFIPFDPEEVEVENDSFSERLRLCFYHHKRLVKIVKDINYVAGSTLFFQIISSTFLICLSAFQTLMIAKTVDDVIGYLTFMSVVFIQSARWCWIGNLLLTQSSKLPDSIWASGWEYELDAKTRSLINIPLIRTKRALELKAGNFWTFSFETFVMILKTAYSVFALLGAVTDKNE